MDRIPLTQHDFNKETLRLKLPEGTGVYLFKDHSDQVLYVGKAKDLKKRVLSYFKSLADIPHKTALMMKRAKALLKNLCLVIMLS